MGRKSTYEELAQRNRELENEIKRLKTAKKVLVERTILLDNILKNSQNIAIATTDLDFRINYYNPMAEKLFGYTAKEVFGKTVQEIHTKENVASDRFERAVKIVRCEGKYCYSVTQKIDKGLRYLDSQVAGIFDPDGKMTGFSLFSRDVTESRHTEAALLRREQYLAGLNEVAQALLVPTDTILFQDFVDKIGPALGASRAYVFINHHSPDGSLLMSQKAEWCAEGVPPEIDNQLLQNLSYDLWFLRWKKVLACGDIVSGPISMFPAEEREILDPQGILALLIVPIMDDGAFVGFVGFDNCVSHGEWGDVEQTFLSAAARGLAQAIKRVRSEKLIRASLKEKEVLLREIHHRVKNNMQVIVSLLRMHSRRTGDMHLGQVFNDCRDRVNAMSFIHEALYQSEDLARIDFKIYLKKLCSNLIQVHGVLDKGVALVVDCCDVALGMDQGIAVGLVICELVSNAFKHAFSKNKGGQLLISLSSLEGDMIELIVQDNGKGLPQEIDIMNPPSSIGLRLAAAAVTRELAGSIEVERNKGTRFIIRFKCKGESVLSG